MPRTNCSGYVANMTFELPQATLNGREPVSEHVDKVRDEGAAASFWDKLQN